jgi:hypothetical protein
MKSESMTVNKFPLFHWAYVLFRFNLHVIQVKKELKYEKIKTYKK